MSDIFASYASADRDAAFRIVGFLEGQGIQERRSTAHLGDDSQALEGSNR